jgi:hypothetical protein
MLKLVMMPPQNDLQRQWAPRLQRSLPDYRVVVPETEAKARHELLDADAAYGWVPPDMLPVATKLRWLQNPQAGPGLLLPRLDCPPGGGVQPTRDLLRPYQPSHPHVCAGAVAGAARLPGGATAAALGPAGSPASLYLVWLKYCVASRCLAMIVAEQSPEALPPHHVPRLATHCPIPRDQLVVETLMIALVMIMSQVLLARIIQGAFPQQDHLTKGLLLDGADKPLTVRVQIRAPRG